MNPFVNMRMMEKKDDYISELNKDDSIVKIIVNIQQ